MKKLARLNANHLKLLALLSMTFDHVGLALLDDFLPFRIVGRLAFPIFAFMIAEGCRYTRNKTRHFLQIFLLGVACQLVMFFATGSLYLGILIVFSLSVLLIYCVQWAQSRKTVFAWLLPAFAVIGLFLLYRWLLALLSETDFCLDYGFVGVLLPVLISLRGDWLGRRVLAAVGMVAVCLVFGGIQWYSLAALPLLLLYNGEKGKRNTKYLFYIYYPAHLAVIYALAFLLGRA